MKYSLVMTAALTSLVLAAPVTQRGQIEGVDPSFFAPSPEQGQATGTNRPATDKRARVEGVDPSFFEPSPEQGQATGTNRPATDKRDLNNVAAQSPRNDLPQNKRAPVNAEEAAAALAANHAQDKRAPVNAEEAAAALAANHAQDKRAPVNAKEAAAALAANHAQDKRAPVNAEEAAAALAANHAQDKRASIAGVDPSFFQPSPTQGQNAGSNKPATD